MAGLVSLFLLNAVTYLAYVGVLLAVVREAPRLERAHGGYRRVLRDGAFVRLAVANAVIIAAGWGVLPWVVPPFAEGELGVSPELIGLLMLANAATVVVAQVPVAKFAEGRRRVMMMAIGGSIIGASCLLVLAAEGVGYAALVIAAVAIGIGECFHTAALMPLVADLAPASLRGRYMATMALSFWFGLALAPTLGTQLLSVSAALTFATCAVAAAAASAAMLRLEHRLPDESRVTPRPGTVPREPLSDPV
jgi:MFS family permease